MKRKHIGIIKRYNIDLNNLSSSVNYYQGLIKIFYKSYAAIAINLNNNAVLLPVYRKFQYVNMELELLVIDNTVKIFFSDIKTHVSKIASADCRYHEIQTPKNNR